jgi:hypothetical protein
VYYWSVLRGTNLVLPDGYQHNTAFRADRAITLQPSLKATWRPPQLRKSSPWRPTLDGPVAQPDMLDSVSMCLPWPSSIMNT